MLEIKTNGYLLFPIPVLSLEYDPLLPYSPLMTNRGEPTWPLNINAICHPPKNLNTYFGHAVSWALGDTKGIHNLVLFTENPPE